MILLPFHGSTVLGTINRQYVISAIRNNNRSSSIRSPHPPLCSFSLAPFSVFIFHRSTLQITLVHMCFSMRIPWLQVLTFFFLHFKCTSISFSHASKQNHRCASTAGIAASKYRVCWACIHHTRARIYPSWMVTSSTIFFSIHILFFIRIYEESVWFAH